MLTSARPSLNQKHTRGRGRMGRLVPLSTCLTVLSLCAGCDNIPGMTSAATLVRSGNSKACTHNETHALLENIIRGYPDRQPSAAEIAALPISLSKTVMIKTDPGVSVTCQAFVSVGEHSGDIAYQVLPAADGTSEILIRWDEPNGAGIEAYGSARWSLEHPSKASARAVEREASSAETQAAVQTAPAPRLSASQTSLVREWNDENSTCRGSDDETTTEQACAKREVLDADLVAAGLCFGHEGEFEAEHEWHVCDANSIQ